jgi:hypothetical protein
VKIEWLAVLLSGCAIEFENNPQDQADYLKANPALQYYLDSLAIPQDDKWHFSADAGVDTDKTTGAKGAHLFFKVKKAWVTPTPSPPGKHLREIDAKEKLSQ